MRSALDFEFKYGVASRRPAHLRVLGSKLKGVQRHSGRVRVNWWHSDQVANLRRGRLAILAAPHALAVLRMRRAGCLLLLPSPLRLPRRPSCCRTTLHSQHGLLNPMIHVSGVLTGQTKARRDHLCSLPSTDRMNVQTEGTETLATTSPSRQDSCGMIPSLAGIHLYICCGQGVHSAYLLLQQLAAWGQRGHSR